MTGFFKSPLSTVGLINSVLPKDQAPAFAAAASPAPPPVPTMAMPAPLGPATIGYTKDDPRLRAMQKAGTSNTIIPAPSAGDYSAKSLG